MKKIILLFLILIFSSSLYASIANYYKVSMGTTTIKVSGLNRGIKRKFQNLGNSDIYYKFSSSMTVIDGLKLPSNYEKTERDNLGDIYLINNSTSTIDLRIEDTSY